MPNEHTDKKYEEDLKKLREEILYMGGLVEDQIQKAVKSLVDRDSELAKIIIERDHEVNRLDVDIDDICIRLLALHQPAGRDLRFITTGLKITTDLERIADHALRDARHARNIDVRLQQGLLVEFQGAFADVHGHITDPFEIGGDLETGGDKPEVAAGGLVQGQQTNADIVDVHVEPVHLMVAFNDDLGELGISVHQRLHRFLNLIFDQSSHVEDFLTQLF